MIDWQVAQDEQDLVERAVDDILEAARAALAARGRFHLALAGGRTPQAVYAALAERAPALDGWRILFGDERCLPPADPERNSRMASAAWLSRVALPADAVLPIPAELGAEAAAVAYAGQICTLLPLDLVILGVGEDGHTASLFPGHPLDPGAVVVAVAGAPKPPAQRVSLGLSVLRGARRRLVLATGAGKAAAVAAWRRGESLPIQQATAGLETRVLLDRAAAPELSAGG